MKKLITDLDLNNKRVLMRVDFNVPMKDGKITDENRIIQALPTIKYALEHNAKLILFSHLGKVKTEEDKATKSLKAVAEKLSELLGKNVIFIPETRGEKLENAINHLKSGEVLMFENTRFEDLDGKKESKNDPELGRYWASLGDIFVNDAFGTAHRVHASNVGIAENISNGNSAVGFLVEKELKFIGEAVNNPKRPLIAILGGAKVSDKIGVIENLLTKSSGKIVLPVDTVVASEFKNDIEFSTVDIDNIPNNKMGLDIGEKTVKLFDSYIKTAKTVVWNGPMGVFEMPNFAKGTIGVCESIASLTNAVTIIGGGDSAAAAISLGYADKFTHISTGGGASLEFLEGKVLPGVEAISNK